MKSLEERLDGIIDNYLAYPVLWDGAFTLVLWECSKHLSIIPFTLIDKPNQINIIPNLIATDVTLAGFILAALTIIVTFKSNLKAKGLEEAGNALELILSSTHYDNIVKVFKNAIVELVACFIVLYSAWAASDNFSINTLNRINCAGILITGLAIGRSLIILFIILNLEKHGKPK